jgi:hypothetical protein
MTLAELTARASNAANVAAFTEWHMPKSSVWMIKSLEVEECPRSCATLLTQEDNYTRINAILAKSGVEVPLLGLKDIARMSNGTKDSR